MASYWVLVPAGATSFDIRMSVDGGYPSSMLHAKDFTVWAATVGADASLAPSGGSASGGGNIVTGSLPARGFGLFVFARGSNDDLLAASGCPRSTAAFWASNAAGKFDVYIPGASVAVLNAAWNQRFGGGIPTGTLLIGRCSA